MAKYFMGSGLAFSEEEDLIKLKKLAAQGWIFEGFSYGFFYKLNKGEPLDIEYSLDYQDSPDEEYFEFFKAAGWQHVVSLADEVHVFSAPPGTQPIYTDRSSLVEKYQRQKEQMKVGSIITFISTVLLGFLSSYVRDVAIVGTGTFVLFIISMVLFIFWVMPFMAYSYRVRKLEKSLDG